MRYILSIVVACLLAVPFVARAESPDLSIKASSIHFSKSTLYAGDTVRIYATVKNEGEVDVTAQVFFYQGAALVGTSQVVSVVAGGGGDDVYVDFTVPRTAFNIRARVQGQSPADINSANDEATTPLYTPVLDADQDGIADDTDNCVNDSNSSQLDTDHDGGGDACDTDDDNDGVSDADENTNGTSSTNSDTDGDGSPDNSDAFPNDPTKSVTPPPTVIAEAPKPVVPVAPVVPAPVVAGVQDEEGAAEPVEPADADVVEVAVNDEPVSAPVVTSTLVTLGNLKLSPEAKFSYRQIDWRTYEFDAKPQGDVAGAFGWDFGDGATSVDTKVTHTFPRAGTYRVTLAVATDSGEMFTDTQDISISFFHLSNPLVDLVLGALALILLGLLAYIFRLRRQDV